VISSTGQPERAARPEKTDGSARGGWGLAEIVYGEGIRISRAWSGKPGLWWTFSSRRMLFFDQLTVINEPSWVVALDHPSTLIILGRVIN